ncbi:hypothetical protein HRbin36_00270 [bacterium HR36]|nr:hypothetical protein HRbin36_00270 [bacterium HR36]
MRHLFAYGTLRWNLLPEAYRPRPLPGVNPPATDPATPPLWNAETFPGLLQAVCQRLSYAGTGRVAGRLYDLGSYPGAVLGSQPVHTIVGDVYLLPPDPAVLVSLDAYEDYDPRYPERSLFRRVPVTVTLEDGRHLDCWMYEYHRDVSQAPPIPGGDYVEHWRWNIAGIKATGAQAV